MSDSTPHNQCTERIETGYWYMYITLVGGNPYKKKIHTQDDGQPLALKMGRTCRVYRVIRQFRVGNVLIYIKSPV